MDLRLGKNAVFFKDTFCLSKKKCTNGQNIHDTLVYGHEDPLQNWCLLQFSWKCDGFESKYCSALIVLAEIASAKVLIFVLALALALAIASAMRNWDLYWAVQECIINNTTCSRNCREKCSHISLINLCPVFSLPTKCILSTHAHKIPGLHRRTCTLSACLYSPHDQTLLQQNICLVEAQYVFT